MFDFEIIGLSGRDKRVYEALLGVGEVSLRGLAEHTGINRGSVYESVQALTRAGLVGFTAYGKRRKYVAHQPEVLRQIIHEKQVELTRAERGIGGYGEFLARQKAPDQLGSFAVLYEGDEGLASILRDVITTLTQERLHAYQVISSTDVREYLYHNFPNFTRERVRHRLFVSVIGMGGNESSSSELAERRRLIAKDEYASRCYTILYGNKTALISLSDTNIPQGIVIDNGGVTSSHRELFWQVWQTLGA